MDSTPLPPPESPKHKNKLQEKLAESRFFTMSLGIHMVLIFFLGSMILFHSYQETEDFAAEGDGLMGDGGDSSTTDSAPADSVPVESYTPQTDVAQADMSDIITSTNTTANFSVAASIAAPTIAVQTDSKISPTGGAAGAGSGFGGAMGGRGRGGRGKARAASGGSDAAEAAVIKGLNWLQANQNADGSWGEAMPDRPEGRIPSMTGLALLCFLGHGETTDSAQYGVTVKKGFDWIYENGTKFEGHLNMKPVFDKSGPYEHGIATYALAEYYAMTKEERMLPLLKKAVDHIIKGQSPQGGWNYSYDKMKSDMSISGWQIQALKAASLGDLKMPNIHSTLDKSVDWIEKMKGPNGGYGYTVPQEERYSLTGVGVLCRLFWNGKQGEVRKGVDWILEVAEKAEPIKYKNATANLYAWYYHTQACLMFGGKAWETWNKWFQNELVVNQAADGSWPPMQAHSHEGMQEDPTKTPTIYRTTLCILMLEVFYRYMPSFKS